MVRLGGGVDCGGGAVPGDGLPAGPDSAGCSPVDAVGEAPFPQVVFQALDVQGVDEAVERPR